MLRWLRIVVVSLCVLVTLLALAGALYQAIATHLDASRFPEYGRLVDVGGHRLMLNCTGVGKPTVILEAGWGDVSVEWRAVQPEIAKFGESAPTTAQAMEEVIRVRCRAPVFRLRLSCIRF
jgi:hypothetical protein